MSDIKLDNIVHDYQNILRLAFIGYSVPHVASSGPEERRTPSSVCESGSFAHKWPPSRWQAIKTHTIALGFRSGRKIGERIRDF
jgi:hypothetical protein